MHAALLGAAPTITPVGLVSSPDPTLCEGKGLVTVERFLGRTGPGGVSRGLCAVFVPYGESRGDGHR